MSSTPKFRRENSVASDLRAPPHSIEAEQAVLGGLMLDRAAWDNVGDVVTADDFFRPDHKLIFRAEWDLPELRFKGVRKLVSELADIAAKGKKAA